MIRRGVVLAAVLVTIVATGCSPAATSVTVGPPATAAAPGSGLPATASAMATTPSAAASPSPASSDGIVTLGEGERPLDAGTYRLELNALGSPGDRFPTARITLPGGWNSANGAFLHTVTGESDEQFVALQFWDVQKIYRHPCDWDGSLYDPGASAGELAAALADRPMRNATTPVDVTLDGFTGKYLEWSVPDDVDFEDCDADTSGHYFESWVGSVIHAANGDRYQQAPGQVDRLWILDVGDHRLVIDAFVMPGASDEEVAQLKAAVESITFE